MRSKALYISEVGLGYIGNSAIVLEKKTDINLPAQLSLEHYVFHSSVSLNRLQLPILNSHLLYQRSLPYVKCSDYFHSPYKFG